MISAPFGAFSLDVVDAGGAGLDAELLASRSSSERDAASPS